MDQMLAIRVFLGAVEAGSLAAAGRRLDLSAAMAGRHLQSLEDHLGVRLLQRSTRKLSLTEAGQRYFDRCKHLLAELDDAAREAVDREQRVQGTLRISAPVTFGALQLGPVVAGYLHQHQGVDIDLSLTDRHVDLLAEGIDVAIRIGQLSDEHLTVRRLAACRMVACASPGYLRHHPAPHTPAELRHHACLMFKGVVSANDWTFFEKTGDRLAGAPKARLVVDNMDLIRAAALADAGIAFGPLFAFADALREGTLVQVLDHYRTDALPIHAVFPTARYIPRMVRGFVDHLAAAFHGVPPWES